MKSPSPSGPQHPCTCVGSQHAGVWSSYTPAGAGQKTPRDASPPPTEAVLWEPRGQPRATEDPRSPLPSAWDLCKGSSGLGARPWLPQNGQLTVAPCDSQQ